MSMAAAQDASLGWQERIRAASADNLPLCIVGSGSKDFYGEAPTGERLETLAHTGIVDYDPSELVVTVRCGTLLAELERVLAGERQMLGFEPPRFGAASAEGALPDAGARATVGGCVATGLAGPRRPYGGGVRDSILGLRLIDGRGDALSFGGRVMKNVAGFDVSRMVAGSLGTLGVVTEVSFKCLPLPALEETRSFELGADEAIRRCNEWSGRPLPISATCWQAGRLRIRLSGAKPAVDAALHKLGGEAVADGPSFWRSIRDHSHPFFAPAPGTAMALWRLSVRSTAPALEPPEEALVEWGGALRWQFAPEAAAEHLRAWAERAGGHATIFRSPRRTQPAFHPLAPALAVVHRRLKSVFDPAGIMNPGRMYSDL